MIERYSDHAANERTFLAWVRTAIAIMAFGFLVQKFDLFLRIAGQSLGTASQSAGGEVVGTAAGLLLIVLGGAMMVFAAIRFRKTALAIDAQDLRPGPGVQLDLTLVRAAAVARIDLVRLSDLRGGPPDSNHPIDPH